MELWDADAWHALVSRNVQVARDMGALVLLQFGLQSLVRSHVLGGNLAAAAQALEEARTIGHATGSAPVLYTEFLLTAWQGDERRTVELLARETGEASARGMGRVAHFARYAAAVLYNGLGRYDTALEAAREAFAHDHLGYPAFVMPELAEAAARTGEHALVDAALAQPVPQTDWALGIRARVRALAGEDPDRRYRESIERLAPHPSAAGARPLTPALRRVAAPRRPARRRARAAAGGA